MNANAKLLSDLFDARPSQQQIKTNGYGAPPSVLPYMKAVWMCLVVPRSDALSYYDGVPKDADAITTTGLAFDFFYDKDFKPKNHVAMLETYIAPNYCTVFMDKETQATRVSVSNDVRPQTSIFLRAVSAVSQLLPWLFTDGNEVDPQEFALLKQAAKMSAEAAVKPQDDAEFWRMTEYFIAKYNYRSAVFRRAADMLTTDYRNSEMQDLQEYIQTKQKKIEELRNDISITLRDIEATNVRLYYIQHHDNSLVAKELMDYLKSGGFRINAVKDRKSVLFTAFTTLSCYDEDMVDQYVLREDKVLDGHCDWYNCPTKVKVPYSHKEMIAFYRAALLDYRFEIKLAASYRITTNTHVGATMVDDTEFLDADHINNPNISYAGCLGSYHGDLTEAERKHDFVAAFAICQQSAGSVNLGEVWPMARVTQELVKSTGKVIRTANGDITFKEAMEIIRTELEEK